MTVYVKCDKCGTTKEFRDGHYLPLGWHTAYWDDISDITTMHAREKHFCDKCWKKMKGEKG